MVLPAIRLSGAAMSPLPFADITCPTLIVHGTRDALAEFSDGVRAHEHIKGAAHVDEVRDRIDRNRDMAERSRAMARQRESLLA